MKKNLTIIGLIIFIGVSAQSDKVDFYFKMGTNTAIPNNKTIDRLPGYHFDDITEYSLKLGYFMEMTMSYNINSRIELYGGFNYNLSKMLSTRKYGRLESESTLTTSYLHIPVLLSWKPFNSFPVSFSGGGYFGLLLTANQRGNIIADTSGMILFASDEYSIAKPIEDEDIKPYYSDYDFGISFQIDYEFLIKSKLSAMVFSRFNIGLNDMVTDLGTIHDNYAYFQNYNLGLMIGAGVKF